MDSRLRQFERAYRASGLPQDEAAWIRERLRVGELDVAGVQLAAFVAHPASRLVLPAGFTRTWRERPRRHNTVGFRQIAYDDELFATDARTWAHYLTFWPQAAERAAIAAVRFVEPECEWCTQGSLGVDFDEESGLPSLSPCGECDGTGICRQHLESVDALEEWLVHGEFLGSRATPTCQLLGNDMPEHPDSVVGSAVYRESSFGAHVPPGDFAAETAREVGLERDDALFRAIQIEIYPWALGYWDPVRERVEVRSESRA